jgi:DNA polymerase type B, organellar and viral
MGIIPAKGYFACCNQSKKAYEYLAFQSYLYGSPIRTGKDPRGEFKIGQYKLDGVCFAKKVVFEFYGCYRHGCQICFNFTDYNQSRKEDMLKLYERTKLRELELKELMKIKLKGFKFISIWEHEFDQIKKSPEYAEFLKTAGSDMQRELDEKTNSIISDRGFFFGGRVNAIRFYAKAEGGTKIQYRDICSLYPFVNKYRSYPKGHPEVIRENFDYSYNAYYGVIKCKVLPPKKLFHPVLPAKINNKLIFSLCNECARTEQQTDCQHSEEERCLYGEWCTPELYSSLLHGYKLVEIYSVLHYKEKIEYRNENDPGLFGHYIDTWLKTKIESSGFPSHVVSEADKDRYIAEYKEKENITLDKANIEYNIGMRTLGKLFCNSLWGRIGLNTDRIETKIVDSMEELVNMLMDPGYDVSYYQPINQRSVFVSYRKVNDNKKTNLKGNVVVAAFVTCWARLVLFEQLEKLGKRVIYYDTDSIIYTVKPGQYEPALGDKLGEWTDEVPKGKYIAAVVATGPKSYTILFSDGSYVTKIKGITQNFSNQHKFTFEAMKSYVDDLLANSGKISQGIVIEKHLDFRRDKVLATIRNVSGSCKVLTFANNKIKKYTNVNDIYLTYPFGY